MFGLGGKKKASNGNRKQAEDLTAQGLVFVKQNKMEAALAKFLESVKADPSYFEAQNNVANCYRAANQMDKAIEAYTNALEIAPDFPQARYNRAVTYNDMGKVREAIADYQTLQKQGGDKQLKVEMVVGATLVVLDSRLRVSDNASSEFAALTFAKSSSLPDRKLETAIATAGSAAGLAMLRQAIRDMKINLDELIRTKPGTPLFVDKVNEYGPKLTQVLTAYSLTMGINPNTGWNDNLAADHKPAQSPAELAHNIEQTLTGVADKYKVKAEDHALLAAIAAIKLLRTSAQTLNPEVSKALIVSSMVAASKSVPFN